MSTTATVHERRDTRSKQAPECRRDGGRPVHPVILHLEAHVEQLFAEDEDAAFFERGAHVETMIADAIAHCEKILDEAKNFAEAIAVSHIQKRVVDVAHRLASEQRRRALRLRNVIIPAVQECYSAAEAAYANGSCR